MTSRQRSWWQLKFHWHHLTASEMNADVVKKDCWLLSISESNSLIALPLTFSSNLQWYLNPKTRARRPLSNIHVWRETLESSSLIVSVGSYCGIEEGCLFGFKTTQVWTRKSTRTRIEFTVYKWLRKTKRHTNDLATIQAGSSLLPFGARLRRRRIQRNGYLRHSWRLRSVKINEFREHLN